MYKVNKAQFLLCAAWKSQWPDHDLPEICLAGRSNVGKSSLINTLTNHQKLAKVSGTPGKTRTLNFFNINDEVCLVDVPGYGYAKVSDSIKESFADMIDTYLRDRELLRGLILIVDYRHKPTRDDIQMYQYAKYYQIPVIVVATKEDKLKRNDLKKNEKRIKETLDFQKGDMFVRFSSLNKVGIDELWQDIFKLCDNHDEIK
ncbi:YihA family ribosome biogenesis GTP-binding protein [Clostridium sp. C1]|uniref:ribosome biogenesis GTP-binding protein YihA/YsxC n=1 Tax=Clostridium sp. C1 TaxID=1155388 RepID=UPI001BAD0A3B|nr:ribosome biogenesis GTP-binding protein YihA/YsxC [Clostridium sp. C1]QUN13521.1 YihA family ribosome biogenesis GTP-binding protein [Clostridium sp. C1]